ncbi:MAG TPA: hypothetical protein VK867_10880 [Candidatus Limnocylindrales bacterium]|nr:hypothetical protein [Candidatus Limnocylindrales bacterium]
MNASNDVERSLAQWMEAVVPKRAPDFIAPSVLAQTRAMSPRPAWLARLLEHPMHTQLSLRRAAGFGRSTRLILAGLLVVALVAGAILVGSHLVQQRSLPPPFGPAGNGLIAANIDGSVVVMQPDGSDVHRLALPFAGVARMAFSRGGTRLAAWWTPDPASGAELGLMVSEADGSDAFELGTTRYALHDTSRIEWSPDDRRFAFSDGSDRLFVADVDGRSVREVAPDATIRARRGPTWSPDGQLAYRCETTDGVLHLCVMGADFKAERILKTSPGTEFAFQHSSWSHDGTRIAYYVDDVIDHPATSPGWDVATIDPETGVEHILTRGTAEHTILPVWTPDSRFILVAGGIVAADGSGVRLIGAACGWTSPSPDGRFAICVAADPPSRLELWPVEGGAPITLPLDGRPETVAWQRLSP